MTIKELIRTLSHYDENMVVTIDTDDGLLNIGRIWEEKVYDFTAEEKTTVLVIDYE